MRAGMCENGSTRALSSVLLTNKVEVMKRNKKDHGESTNEQNEKPPLARTVRSKSGKLVKQYPSKLGYHGRDPERDLNPEE